MRKKIINKKAAYQRLLKFVILSIQNLYDQKLLTSKFEAPQIFRLTRSLKFSNNNVSF